MTMELDARALNALVVKCQAVMVDYLRPDGIEADAALDRLIGLLDGPEQRAAQGVSEAAARYMIGAYSVAYGD